jgi:hypothetical protein
VSRVKDVDGGAYELFGQKIAVTRSQEDAKARNKFTLELTAESSPAVAAVSIDAVLAKNSSPILYPSSPGKALASQFEEDDGVLLAPPPPRCLSDGTAPHTPTRAKSPTTARSKHLFVIFFCLISVLLCCLVGTGKGSLNSDEDGSKLIKASAHADHLHKSAVELEGWLEDQVFERPILVSILV